MKARPERAGESGESGEMGVLLRRVWHPLPMLYILPDSAAGGSGGGCSRSCNRC